MDGFGDAVTVQWVIYRHPPDHPEKWVIRPWRLVPRKQPQLMRLVWVFDTLEEARCVIPAGLALIPRNPLDDPAIYEIWI